jgi:GNAT superfamily N-acetyltransferase
MLIWQMTQMEFVGNYPVNDTDLEDFERLSRLVIEEQANAFVKASMQVIKGYREFYLADIRHRELDVALVQKDTRYNDLYVVGGYIDDTLWIEPALRGKGLGAILVLKKADKMAGVLEPTTYTSAGKATHIAAHRKAILDALSEGYRVSARVLADYEDLG